MKNVNTALKTAYNTLLSQISSAVVYANYIPAGAESEKYIVFSNVSNGDISTKNSSDVSAIMQVSIYTYSDTGNSGNEADLLAGEILNLLYPTTQSVIGLGTGLQMLSTVLLNDTTQEPIAVGQRVYIDRILQFKHEIFIL